MGGKSAGCAFFTLNKRKNADRDCWTLSDCALSRLPWRKVFSQKHTKKRLTSFLRMLKRSVSLRKELKRTSRIRRFLDKIDVHGIEKTFIFVTLTLDELLPGRKGVMFTF